MSMISGYAATFDSDSNDLGFIEEIDPGAFDRTLANRADVRCLYNHDPNLLLGRSAAGTLRLRVDSRGLYYECDINDGDPDAVAALAKVRRGDCSGSSFSFQAVSDVWDWSSSPPRRRLLEVDLIDVSPVTYPAYPATTALARSMVAVALRYGKTISAATADRLQAVHDSLMDAALGLRDLIDVAQSGSPLDSDVGDGAVMSPKKNPADEASVPQAQDLYGLDDFDRQLKRRLRTAYGPPIRSDVVGRQLGRRLERYANERQREAELALRSAIGGV